MVYICAKLEINLSTEQLGEKTFTLQHIQPQYFYGVNNQLFQLVRSHFPKLQFVARGEDIRVSGEDAEIERFAEKLELLESMHSRRAGITEELIAEVFGGAGLNTGSKDEPNGGDHDILLYGTRGQPIRTRTRNQRELVQSALRNDIVFALGPAGTGKTYTAVAMAVRALRNREIRRIILTRPAVEAGENLGFLPGDLKEKIDPYLRPLYDALEDMIPAEKLKAMIETRTIEVAPMAFMRGRTLDHCYVILDEAQNSTDMQLKMFLTRMGPNAKLIITGDLTQIDLPKKQMSGLKRAVQLLNSVDGIGFVHLDTSDVVRHRLVKAIIEAYGKDEAQEKNPQ
jgi:phosphate starvation-inducible protein PhoH and related proteins